MIALPAPYLLIEKEITGSTNADAMALAAEGASAFTLIWAHAQTAARGRFDRKWIADKGNLYWSVILRPPAAKPIDGLVFVAGLAIAEVASNVLPAQKHVRIKWPNDVLINNAKFSGTLIEVSQDRSAVVVGVGINLAVAPAAGQTAYPATCLIDAGAGPLGVDTLCEKFSAAFLRWYLIWEKEGMSADLRAKYLSQMWHLGERISVSLDRDKERSVSGINRGINRAGHLLLETTEGTEEIVTGDVLF